MSRARRVRRPSDLAVFTNTPNRLASIPLLFPFLLYLFPLVPSIHSSLPRYCWRLYRPTTMDTGNSIRAPSKPNPVSSWTSPPRNRKITTKNKTSVTQPPKGRKDRAQLVERMLSISSRTKLHEARAFRPCLPLDHL